MIKEIIIVEGRHDESAVKTACAADTIATGGFGTGGDTIKLIEKAYQSRGILILTDPDHAGEQIRARLTKRFPDAKHAWIPREAAGKGGDVGVENASPEAIRAAIVRARVAEITAAQTFYVEDMIKNGLTGGVRSAYLRDRLGSLLGIGYGNTKTLLKRLNAFGVTKEEFAEALNRLRENDDCNYSLI